MCETKFSPNTEFTTPIKLVPVWVDGSTFKNVADCPYEQERTLREATIINAEFQTV